MKETQKASSRKISNKGRPDYYISPTHDFTQYTRDCEEKYWSRDKAFNWAEDVRLSLKQNMEKLNHEGFQKMAFMVLPMIKERIQERINDIQLNQLPQDEDALRDIGECIPGDLLSIQEALTILGQLRPLQEVAIMLKDQMEISKRELADLKELQRLGLAREGINVKHVTSENQRKQQGNEISRLAALFDQAQKDWKEAKRKDNLEWKKLQTKVSNELSVISPKVLDELQKTLKLVDKTLFSNKLPKEDKGISQIKDLILKRQLRGLKDIANHALVVEQSAIAPLTMGIIHYKRYREIQEAMTTFIRDEAKHSATFRRFLVEKLEAKEFISTILIKGANRYMWLARFLPATGMFLAVIVEIIGAAYLEFFANEKYMPDKLFCSICTTISTQDEKRHIDLCVAMYNELFRKSSAWERARNKMALKKILKSVYGDKDEDHHLIQAFRAFGVESEVLYHHIVINLSSKLARIGTYVEPEALLRIILGKKAQQIQFSIRHERREPKTIPV